MAAPSFVAVGAQNSGTTGAVTYAHPAGVAADDVEIAALESAATAGVVTPAAWVDVAGSPRAQGSNTLAVNALIHRYTSGDIALVGAASGNHQTGAIAAFRGVDTTTPVDTTSNNSGNSATPVGLGITTTVDDCRVLLVAVWGADDATAQFSSVANSSLTGVTVHYQAGTTNGNGGGVLIASGVKATAGAVAAWSANLAASQTWAAIVVALRPAPTSGPPGQSAGAGSWYFTGGGVGARVTRSGGSGVWALVGAGTGRSARRATGAGAFSFAGAGAGKTGHRASAAGIFTLTGSGTGTRPALAVRQSSGSGLFTVGGAGSGVRPAIGVRQGSGSGLWTYAGTGTGRTTRRGTTAGSFAFAGAGRGKAPRRSSGSGGLVFTGAGAAITARRATGVGTWSYAGTGAGVRHAAADGHGVATWAGVGAAWRDRPSPVLVIGAAQPPRFTAGPSAAAADTAGPSRPPGLSSGSPRPPRFTTTAGGPL